MEEAKEARTELPEPDAALWLVAGLIVEMARGKPERIDKMAERMSRFVIGQRDFVKVVRIRPAAQDAANRAAMEAANLWLERTRPILKLLAAQKDI